MTPKRAIKYVSAIMLLLVFSLIPAMTAIAAPSIPHYFYGTVKLDGGTDAPIGTVIEAYADGIINNSSNPITITEAGHYGSPDALAEVPRLLVQGNIDDGAEIVFYVDGVLANETAVFMSGGISVVNLTTGAPSQTGGDTTGGTSGGTTGGTTTGTTGGGTITLPIVTPLTTTGLVTSGTLEINSVGQIMNTVSLSNQSMGVTLTIQKSTTITGTARTQLELTVKPVNLEAVQARTHDQSVVAGFDFGPSGTVFSPEIEMTVSYDPNNIPAGSTEANLMVAWWDTQNNQWVTLDGIVDPATHTITVMVQHFTEFAVITVPYALPTTDAGSSPAPDTNTDTSGSGTVSDTASADTTDTVSDTNDTASDQSDASDTGAQSPAAQDSDDSGTGVWVWWVLGGAGVIVLIVIIWFSLLRRNRM